MEFLQLVEAIQIEAAYTDRAWANDGSRLTGRRRASDPHYQRRLLEAVTFMQRIYSGATPLHRLREAMSTSDFPLLFGDIIDRQTLANYAEWRVIWPTIAKRGTVPDFRNVSRYRVTGGDSVLKEVKELTEYEGRKLAEARYQYKVAKYGARMPFSFEAMINDDLDLLQSTPEAFARASRRSEDRYVTGMFVSSTGPNATFFAAGNKNQIIQANGAAANNPPLSITGLQDGFTVLWGQKDSVGEPIVIEAAVLMVPPTLRVTAENILNATSIEIGTDADPQRMTTVNWMRNNLTLVVNPYLNVLNTTSGNTAWYLFAAPNTGAPALEFGFLRGYEQPQLFMKSPNAVRVGAGTVDPFDGDFDNDSLDYKIRHIFGGTTLDTKMAVASTGTGSA